MQSKLQEIVGQKYGMLLVQRVFIDGQIPSGRKRWMAECLCDCGKQHITQAHSIKAQRTTSCGCRRDQYLKNSGKNSTQFTGYEEIRGTTYHKIKVTAERRGLKFNLPKKFLWQLYQSQGGLCALSGLPITWFDPTMVGKGCTRCTVSIDRIDSSKGYSEDNVQLVHKKVNIMKNVYSQDEFIQLCKLITENNNAKTST